MKFIGYNIISILLIALAGYMVYADKPKWGWLIFAALLVTVIPNINNNDK